MDEILSLNQINDYEHLKHALNTELKSAAISFVRIGYLLKTARDTDLLKDTEYQDVNEFASKEFGLDKSQVSRFMAINDRFSIGGYSEHLEDKYAEYGSSKLSIMLTLPDSINEQLSPDYSKSDIQAIKEEYQAEQKISDIEVLTETPAEQPVTKNDEFLALIIHQLVEEHPDPAKTIKWGMTVGVQISEEDVSDSYLRDGDAAYSIRISGKGRFLISCKAAGVNITNMRTDENSPVSWSEFRDVLIEELEHREWPEEASEEKPKRKVEKSASTERKPHKNDIKEPKNEKKPEKAEMEEPKNDGNTPVEPVSDDISESSEKDPEDKQEIHADIQGSEEIPAVQSQNEDDSNSKTEIQEQDEAAGQNESQDTNEAAVLKSYGRFMEESKRIRQEASHLIGQLESHDRLINDVPPLTLNHLKGMWMDAKCLMDALDRIIEIYKYYDKGEDEE